MEDSGEPQTAAPDQGFRRVLGLWDLIFYGIVLIQPIAAVGLFGIATKLSRGHMVTTILAAMLAMMLTAVSYGRMASLYPSAGSAYTYVGRGLNPHFGFLAGWAMFLDYLVVPVVNTVYGALSLQRLLPATPYWFGVLLVATTITVLNLRGIRTTARSNIALLAAMCAVISVFIVLAIRYVFLAQGWTGLITSKPVYNPATFDIRAVLTATSFAALTYIGFDGVTTLAEDVRDPRRNVLLATVLVCLITGIFSGSQIYLAQLVWPDYSSFPNLETAFMDVCARVGGPFLLAAMALILFIACLGSGLAGQVGAARLLFGMGRDNVLPRAFFGYLDPKSNTPSRNILLIGVVAAAGSFSLNYEQAAEVLNFGAFLAFMGVNLAAARQFYWGRPTGERRLIADCLVPLAGFLCCLAIWWSLPRPAKMVGGAWLLGGILYAAVTTRGFRRSPKMIDFTE